MASGQTQWRILAFGASNTWGFQPVDPKERVLHRLPFEQRWTGVAQRALGARFGIVEDALQVQIPETQNWGASDVAYLTITPPVVDAPNVMEAEIGDAQFSFARPTWEDTPTQFHIVNTLANLPVHEIRGGHFQRFTGGDLSIRQQRILR